MKMKERFWLTNKKILESVGYKREDRGDYIIWSDDRIKRLKSGFGLEKNRDILKLLIWKLVRGSFFIIFLKKKGQNLPGGLIIAIQIDGTHQGFRSRGQNTLFLTSAVFFFSLAEFDLLVESQFFSQPG